MHETRVEIANKCFRVSSKNPEAIGYLNTKCVHFISKKRPFVEIKITGSKKTGKGKRTKFSRSNKGLIKVETKDSTTLVDLKKRKCLIKAKESMEEIENALTCCAAFFLLKENCLIVHASALERKEKGFVFVGDPKQGKTTITRLSPEAKIIADDACILKKEKTHTTICPLPFANKCSLANKPTNAEKILFIKKAKKTTVKGMNPMDSAIGLFSRDYFFIVLKEKNLFKEIFKKTLALSKHFAETTPCFELHFRKSPEFWKKIQ